MQLPLPSLIVALLVSALIAISAPLGAGSAAPPGDMRNPATARANSTGLRLDGGTMAVTRVAPTAIVPHEARDVGAAKAH
jgi:hypothetical protein